MITDLRKLNKGQHFRFREVNGQKVNDKRIFEFIKVACGWWLLFGKPNDKKQYRDLYQFTMKDEIKVQVLPKQSELFKSSTCLPSGRSTL